MDGRGRQSLEEEKVWDGGAVAGQGLGSGPPAVRAAEAAGPTATAEGHGEGDDRVHTRRAAGEADGGKAQLVVGAHRLGHRWQGSRQHPHLEGRAGGGSGMGICPAEPSRSFPLPPTDPRLGCPGDPLCAPSHTPRSGSSCPAPARRGGTPLHPRCRPVFCGPGTGFGTVLRTAGWPHAPDRSPCWGSSRHRRWW